jgi:ABC-type nitrate/sulfonate/bicarbonate transport system ATPase subunit
MVFQNQGLFPWMTVIENVAIGLEMRGVSKNERSKKALDLINRVGLGEFSNAYPFQLSGGMRQRTAIMRAFLTDPQVLLMDEPFASLDAQTRYLMQEELLDTWLNNPKTVIYVTHDIEEAIYLGDRILVMSGRPGTIQADIAITHSRPRLHTFRKSEEFDSIQQHIWELIEAEVRQSLGQA